VPRWEEAEASVAKRHPRPSVEPFTAGMWGFIAAGAVAAFFMVVAGLDEEAMAGAFVVTAAVGALAPYLYFRNEHRQHYERVSAEYDRMKEAEKHANRT
jgi:membrane associated rhomboid family serine protease